MDMGIYEAGSKSALNAMKAEKTSGSIILRIRVGRKQSLV
jgi:hypothetical protein